MKTVKVVAAVIRKDDLILATQRGYGEFMGGWEFPGGKVEENETEAAALKREIEEELETEISVDEYIATIECDYPSFHLSMSCYFCTLLKEKMVLKEAKASRWLSYNELDEVEWLKADEELIEIIKQKMNIERGKKMNRRINVNEIMPDYTFNTAWRNDVRLSEEVLKADKTVLWVMRYIGCSLCRLDVELLKERYEEFKKRNVQVLVVMQSDQKHLQADLKDENYLGFDIVADTDFQIYNDLMILPFEKMELTDEDKEKFAVKAELIKKYGFVHGDYEGNEQQLPAQFIIDQNRTVLYAHYAENLFDLLNIDGLLAELDK